MGHTEDLARLAAVGAEALLEALRRRLPEPTLTHLELESVEGATALALAPGSLRAVLAVGRNDGQNDGQERVDHSRALAALHRGLAPNGRCDGGSTRALR